MAKIFSLKDALGGATITDGGWCQFLNDNGVRWSSQGRTTYDNTFTVNIPCDGYYNIRASVDDQGTVWWDGNQIISNISHKNEHRVDRQWITAGNHSLRVWMKDNGGNWGGAVIVETDEVTIFNLRGQPGSRNVDDGTWCHFLRSNAVWFDNGNTIDRTYTVNFPVDAYYHFRGSCDNYGTVWLDGAEIVKIGDFKKEYSATVLVKAGNHSVRVQGVDTGWGKGIAFTIDGDIQTQQGTRSQADAIWSDYSKKNSDADKLAADKAALDKAAADATAASAKAQQDMNASKAQMDQARWKQIPMNSVSIRTSNAGGFGSASADSLVMNLDASNCIPVVISDIYPTSNNSPSNEGAANAFDGNPNTKYLNFDKQNAGVTVKLNQGRVVKKFTITTANDAVERDPASYKLYGSNDNVNWVLLSEGPLSLSNNRFAVSDEIAVANTNAYVYYFIKFPSIKNDSANSVQVSEINYYHEQDGATWTDSNNRFNATLTQPTVYTSGQGSHFSFNGTSQRGNIGMPVVNDMTWIIWFNTTSSAGNPNVAWYHAPAIVGGEIGGDVADMGIGMAQGRIVFGMGQPDTTFVSTKSYNDGKWHQLAVTRNTATGQAQIFVDGALDNTHNNFPKGARINGGLGIAYNPGGTSENFQGKLAQIRAYSSVLTQSQIQALYSVHGSRFLPVAEKAKDPNDNKQVVAYNNGGGVSVSKSDSVSGGGFTASYEVSTYATYNQSASAELTKTGASVYVGQSYSVGAEATAEAGNEYVGCQMRAWVDLTVTEEAYAGAGLNGNNAYVTAGACCIVRAETGAEVGGYVNNPYGPDVEVGAGGCVFAESGAKAEVVVEVGQKGVVMEGGASIGSCVGVEGSVTIQAGGVGGEASGGVTYGQDHFAIGGGGQATYDDGQVTIGVSGDVAAYVGIEGVDLSVNADFKEIIKTGLESYRAHKYVYENYKQIYNNAVGVANKAVADAAKITNQAVVEARRISDEAAKVANNAVTHANNVTNDAIKTTEKSFTDAGYNISNGVVKVGNTIASGAVNAGNDIVKAFSSVPAPKKCVVATELTRQRMWSKTEYLGLTAWSEDKLDKSFLGRCLHYGYPVVANRTFIPAIKRKGSLMAKYYKWTFENGVAMLRGRKYDWKALPSFALWIVIMTIVGVFITKEQHDKI